MGRLLLVANPAASGFTASLHRYVVEILRGTHDVTPVWPDGPDEAQSVAAEAASDGADLVVAMGGDGVVHRVANGVVGSATALGVIPAGTTNVFARLMGYPRSARAAAEAIESGRISPEPTIYIETMGPEGEDKRHAVFAAGLGYDAELIRDSDRTPLRKVGFGVVHYARSGLRTARTYRKRRPGLDVEVGGDVRRAVTVLLQVHDEYSYFGRRVVTLSPAGGPAMVTVRRLPATRLARTMWRALRHRSLKGVPGVEVWHPFESVAVETAAPVAYQADGESLGDVTSLMARFEPDALLVIRP
jgi:diacylglycerol kinase family enzyme